MSEPTRKAVRNGGVKPSPWQQPAENDANASNGKRISLLLAFAMVFAFIAMQIAGTAFTVILAILTGVQNPLQSMPVLMGGLIVSDIVILGMLVFLISRYALADVIRLKGPLRLNPALSLGLTILVMAITMTISLVYSIYLISPEDMQPVVAELVAGLSGSMLGIAALIAVIAIAAPIIEELIFRGFLQNSLEHYLNGHAAIWLAAGIFGLIHFDLAALPMLTLLGAAFGYIYRYTGALWLAMLGHAINNSVGVTLMLAGT